MFIDHDDAEPGTCCIEEGFFYADDLPERDPDGFAELRDFVRHHRAEVTPGYWRQIRLLPRRQFVEEVVFHWGYRNQATIVGYNLPFDLSRLAIKAAPARGRNRGGISLQLWDHNGQEHKYRPRLLLRHIDRYRTLIQFSSTMDRTQFFRGRFLDLHTLAFAHSDERGLSLEAACGRFGSPYKKRAVAHGVINEEYIAYCRDDVAATAALFRATNIEHRRHPIDLPPQNAFSAATIGRAYWRRMGIPATAQRWPDFPAETNGIGMAAFYGGRAECRIRRVELPVAYVDFRSMYMTCNALMGTWPLITADHLKLVDATHEVRSLIAEPNLVDRCFDPTLWPRLHTLVEVDPNGAILPVRARYEAGSDTWGIGVNPFQSDRSAWYPLADVLASALLGGPLPQVRRAFRVVGEGSLTELRRVALCGEISIDPKREDFFRAAVEHRHRTQTANDLDEKHRSRLDQFLKVLANASGFGSLAQFDRHRDTERIPIKVYADNTTFTTTTSTPEEPGEYCMPPIAACITGAARLMLALLENQVTKAGGSWMFCDTDSMAIVATRRGGPIACPTGPLQDRHDDPTVRALSWKQVDTIVDRFCDLNPYNAEIVKGSILRLERQNYDTRGRRRELRCFAISAKRYQLVSPDNSIAKRSRHGLGHLLNPLERTPNAAEWVDQAWTYLRTPDSDFAWLDYPAVSRMTVSSAEALHWFSTLNADLPYAQQIKPGNFLLIAYPDPLDPAGAQPVAPYENDASQWLALEWIDRNTGLPIRILTQPIDGTQRPSSVHVRTYRDVLNRYLAHPESKSLAADGQPVRADTTGILIRRPVRAIQPITYIGKEANDLDARAIGLLTDTAEHTNTYEPDDHEWTQLVVPALRTMPSAEISARSGVHRRTVQRLLAGKCTPHAQARQALVDCAIERAAQHVGRLRRTEKPPTLLYRYITAQKAVANPPN
ncbi:MAG TPA: hypothetical protein VMM60_03425 [Ilumatobacter sp.]|nr:hypothetical protein [Ilumatobacter sp.]